MEMIQVQGAHIHNLKNINVNIPKQKLIVMTGISGSGKSSLAFDILFEEGKNQYLRSIGILAGLDNEDRFERLEGIGPTVAVRQNLIRQNNPCSTVGSKTGLLNELALIYATEGKTEEGENRHLSPSMFLYTSTDGMCINCQGRGTYYEVDLKQLVPNPHMTLIELYHSLKVTSGFMRLLEKKYGDYFDKPFWELPDDIRDEVVYGTYDNGKQSYCIERILRNAYERGEDVEAVYRETICLDCKGERVGDEAREVLFEGKSIGELGKMTLSSLLQFVHEVPKEQLAPFSQNTLKHIERTLETLIRFRLGHLSLYRALSSLSGGELQRIFLHMHIESKLDSLIYVFDEPMAGLHPSEKQSIIQAVKTLRDIGNTVIVVEHDKEMIKEAEYIIEIGPKAGVEGGEIVFEGSYQDYIKADTLLSRYVSGKSKMPERQSKKAQLNSKDCLHLSHANAHYLKDLTVDLPLHMLVGIAGLSGSGKSSLIEETLIKRLATAQKYGTAEGIEGVEKISGFIKIGQEPIGRSSNSTPASYIGIWDKIRELFAKEPEARKNQMVAGHFSFHSKGACPECGGSGYERIFLTSDFSVDKVCKACHGMRFNKESLRILYKGKSISQVLEMNINEAVSFFEDQTQISKPLRLLKQMGMGYLKLGQPTSSLSGGEAQRIKLAKELGKSHKKNILYVLDEPTTGLSLYDTALLIELLDHLVKEGNSVIVIEHHIELLKKCDYIIEMGPQGGNEGGDIIAKGTPEALSKCQTSKTGRYLV